jgi:hypothetical protein
MRPMTTIVCTADLHENLIGIPECELLLIAGDVSFAFSHRPESPVGSAGTAPTVCA